MQSVRYTLFPDLGKMSHGQQAACTTMTTIRCTPRAPAMLRIASVDPVDLRARVYTPTIGGVGKRGEKHIHMDYVDIWARAAILVFATN